MSRRSLISAEENLIRSQRRGVPNVRMWSEQETPPRVAWAGYEEEPAIGGTPPSGTPPSGVIRYKNRNSGATVVSSMPTDALGDAFVACVHGRGYRDLTLPSGWTEMLRGQHVAGDGGDNLYWVLGLVPSWKGTESKTFGATLNGGNFPKWEVTVFQFVGIDGGTWNVYDGPNGGSTGFIFADIPLWPIRMQITAVGGNLGGPEVGPVAPHNLMYGMSTDVDTIQFPQGSNWNEAQVQQWFTDAAPNTPGIAYHYYGGGVAGTKRSHAYGFGWSP